MKRTDKNVDMTTRTLRRTALLVVAVIVAGIAGRAWGLDFGLSETKEELKLKYDIAVEEHSFDGASTGRVTVVLTLADEGRLKPLDGVELGIPGLEKNKDGSNWMDLVVWIDMRKSDDGKRVGRVHLRKDLAERAVIRLNTRTLDGKTMNLTGGMYHAIPIAKYLKSAPVGSAGTRTQVVLNGVEFAYRWCPAGEFNMGASADEKKQYEDRFVARHRVRLSNGFWMQETEVTQTQYEMVMGKRPSFWQWRTKMHNPVEQVSWQDAVEFCAKLSEMDPGHNYRLPTEAEWEYACRAGTSGSRYGDLLEIAWVFVNTDTGEGSTGHRPVGTKKPNAWGLYDMFGNVAEWCSDWNGPPSTVDTSDPTGPKSGTGRVIRGGDCFADGGHTDCLAGARAAWRPSEPSRIIGFRVVRIPVTVKPSEDSTKR